MRRLIVVGCDSGYFPFARDCIASLRPCLGDGTELGLLDFGLTSAERDWLAANGIKSVEAVWNLDFPLRGWCETNKPGFKGMVCRPFIPDYFPGFDSYLWIDVDAWVQKPEVIGQYFDAAERTGFAASIEVDRSYFKYVSDPDHWKFEIENIGICLGEAIARKIGYRPMINSGVIAFTAKAPHWAHWRRYLQNGLNGISELTDITRMVEMFALNAVVYVDGLPVARFPATDNWMAILASPAWNIDTKSWVHPAPPHEPIRILHLSNHLLSKQATVPLIGRGLPHVTIGTGLHYSDTQQLIESSPKILAEMHRQIEAAKRSRAR